MSTDQIAVLRIELIDIAPLIWLRVAVTTSTNLVVLHKIIQAAMGWLDYHLWEFETGEARYGVPRSAWRGIGAEISRRQSQPG
ncbi:MAG: plasmid pRiA4b ORF-3 family protein [Rhodospirillaceae bacterium]|nr:plasmid pRiA4b ORF-3 family protein [Rhodospirillaceae bacterium]